MKGFQRVKHFEMSFPLPSSPPPGLNKYPPAGRCLSHPAGFCSQAFVWGWERGQDPSASPGTHMQTGSCLFGMLRGRQEVRAACARCHRAWGHPRNNPGVPQWPPAVVPLACHITGAFCPSLGATYGTGPAPSCPHCVSSTPCRLCAWPPVPPGHGLPVDTPKCQFTPTTPGTFQAENRRLVRDPTETRAKTVFFYSDLWPSGAHHLAFHLHPKSHFNYTSGRDHFRELLFGAKFWWEKNLMNSRTILKGPRRLESQPEARPCQ